MRILSHIYTRPKIHGLTRARLIQVLIYLTNVDLIDHMCTARKYPPTLGGLANHLNEPNLSDYIRRFLYDRLYPDADVCGMDAPIEDCPTVSPFLRLKVFHSATATYYAPSDLSGIGGMHRERIRATPTWQNGPGRYDCIFVDNEPDIDGFAGLHVVRVKLFLSFTANDGTTYPCALVEWFSRYGDSPCKETGLWRVVPDRNVRGHRVASLIHIDSILRGAHLIGVPGSHLIPTILTYSHSLDVFELFYVNKYIDHHAHEIAF